MKKFALSLAVLVALTACQSNNQHPISLASSQSAPSDFAKLVADEMLGFAIGMVQGDSLKPLTSDYVACVKQPHPKLQQLAQTLINQELSQEEIALLDETFVYLKDNKTPTDPTLKAKVERAKPLMASPKMQHIIATLVGMGGDKQLGDKVHSHINARLGTCAKNTNG